MQTIEYKTEDKSSMASGPWQGEPDKKQWLDKQTGLPCLIVRNGTSIGNLCGYVGVGSLHPWHNIAYNEKQKLPCTNECEKDFHYGCRPETIINVHGGLTYSGPCANSDSEEKGICHKPDPGEPENIWWFGFDCAHAGDLCPGMSGIVHHLGDEYRDFQYVERQCELLAKQLKAVEVEQN